MINKTIVATAVLATACLAFNASAGQPYGTGFPIVIPSDNITIKAIFDNEWGSHTGNLYFLGTGTASAVLEPAPNSDATGLGQFLFNNNSTPVGAEVDLIGDFDAGEVLHFAYDLVSASPPTSLLRTDVAADQEQFAWDPENSFFAIEDDPNPTSDLDYNDIIVGICFIPIPGPGALAAMVGLLALPQRRRRDA